MASVVSGNNLEMLKEYHDEKKIIFYSKINMIN